MLDENGLTGAEAYYEKFQKTLGEWRKFISGDMRVDANVIPSDIFESWMRCRDMGLDPTARRVCQPISLRDISRLLHDNAELIEVSKPVINHLFKFVEGSGFLVALFDCNAVLLDIIGGAKASFIGKGFWSVGSSFAENMSGNNSVGTVVEIKRPVQIFGPQHYCRGGHNLMGSSAPIFSPRGEFLGGVTMISRFYNSNPHTFGMVIAAAQAIENELRTRKAVRDANEAFSDREISYSYQKAVIASFPEALIAVNNSYQITMINDKARKMFDLENQVIEGKSIHDVFGEENRHLFKIIGQPTVQTDVEVRIFVRQTGNDYTVTCNPILSQENKTIGKIIILNELKRAKSMVTKMIGAGANFRFSDICGSELEFLKTVEQARIVASSNSNVLLLGESGTGKDIFVQAIHNASDRKNGPYVAINCAAIPRDLISSELFGYSEGAFTGSRRGGYQGKFELADGGTIFLDEIAETPLELQAVLLRVIEDKSVTRIGSTRARPINVRIVAATNKDLQKEVQRGTFRQDLYYRLNVFAIHLVPLRERPADIPLLTHTFVKKYSHTLKKKIPRVDDKVLDIFLQYAWPGNVRELQNVVERMMHVVTAGTLTADLIPREIVAAPKSVQVGAKVPESAAAPTEKERIIEMIRSGLSKARIARDLKIERCTLYRRMKKYGIADTNAL